VIVLDTHVWIWWISDDERLTPAARAEIETHQGDGLGISAISCWEVAKLVQLGRLELRHRTTDWLEAALAYPGCRLLELTPQIVVQSTTLPGVFHRDPADQMIVATALVWGCPLLTADRKILDYPHVETLSA
jgi:PIN domain nuclease of toxin-antitoxin system